MELLTKRTLKPRFTANVEDTLAENKISYNQQLKITGTLQRTTRLLSAKHKRSRTKLKSRIKWWVTLLVLLDLKVLES